MARSCWPARRHAPAIWVGNSNGTSGRVGVQHSSLSKLLGWNWNLEKSIATGTHNSEPPDHLERRLARGRRGLRLRHMVSDFTIALAIGLVIGFILGYGLRAIISYRRHRRARRRSLPLLSLVCRTARPAAVPHGPKDCGDLPPLAVLKQYSDGVATTRERPTATYRCTRTRRSRLPSRPSVERWRCQFWADCTTNISKRSSDNLCDFCNAAEFF